ncbi:unnamed protein product [Prunus brigantina]
MNTLTPAMVAAVSIKLDRTNYSLWLAQFLPILRSRDLMGFVDGSHECPPKYISGSTTVNPAYTTWIQQDQLILSWINNSLSQSVVSTVSRDLSVSDYLDKMNMIADNLALAGQQVPDDELVQIIMNNLGPAYEMVLPLLLTEDVVVAVLGELDVVVFRPIVELFQIHEDLTSSKGGVSTTGIQSHPNVLFTFHELTNSNSIVSLPSNSLPAQSIISPNNDLVVMPHDPSPPHHMPNLPSTEQESVQHNNHAPDEPDISSTEVTRLSNVPTHPMVTRSRLGVQKPNPKYALNFIVDTKLLEPTCFSQAMKQEEWRQAMAHEFNAL